MIRRYSSAIMIFGMVFSLTARGNNFDTSRLNDDPTQEQPTKDTTEPGGEQVLVEAFEPAPDLSPTERENILAKYDYLDPNKIVPSKALADTLVYFEKNKSKIHNQDYIAVINFAQNSKEKRFYIIDMKTGAVQNIHVAHGKGSDLYHDGYAEKFSNKSGSNASSLGFYSTAETYYGNHGLSLRLDGRSATNSNARSRAIVLHGADYVKEAALIQGRSWGCPAVSSELRNKVIGMLKGGALINAVY
ncbi:MAG: murein L,D-transpeptidase catalytic domain family protein [Pseudobdellovibrionaceae bacterium]